MNTRRAWIDQHKSQISLNEQLILMDISKAGYYYEPVSESAENMTYMNLIDQEYTAHPFYGSRRMMAILLNYGHHVNRKRVIRLMRLMGLEAIYPKRNLSKANVEDKKYPYLLKDIEISTPNQVWGTDITYIPVRGGFLYLTAIMDWHTRYILSWKLSNTLDVGFCLDALNEAFEIG